MSDHNSKPPSFQSNLPQHLLANASPESKWLMENISVLTQKTDYLVSEQTEQSVKLKSIEHQCLKTNGRVSKIEGQIEVLESVDKEVLVLKPHLEQIVTAKQVITKLTFSKYFWLGFGVLLVGFYTILKNPNIGEWVSKFI